MSTFNDLGEPLTVPAGDAGRVEDRSKPELLAEMGKLLRAVKPADGRFETEVQRLAGQYGDSAYTELIHLLSHLRLAPAAARYHWGRIVEHRNSMQRRLRSPVDLRVALASYFIEVNGLLKTPKLIELDQFERIRDSGDELTGLCDLRLFERQLAREIRAARRRTDSASLLTVDVDDWIAYRDRVGPEAGNAALSTIARLLLSAIRETDYATRCGEDEFALLLPATSKVGAAEVARRAREAAAGHTFPGGNSQPSGRLTLSIGIATYPADARDGGELFKRARRATYTAKARGKNQVCLHGHDRRSYARSLVALQGELSVSPSERHALTISNLSEDGLLVRVGHAPPLGGLIEIQLTLPDSGRQIAGTGRVVRVTEHDAGLFELAIRTVDIEAADRESLLRFLRQDETAAG